MTPNEQPMPEVIWLSEYDTCVAFDSEDDCRSIGHTHRPFKYTRVPNERGDGIKTIPRKVMQKIDEALEDPDSFDLHADIVDEALKFYRSWVSGDEETKIMVAVLEAKNKLSAVININAGCLKIMNGHLKPHGNSDYNHGFLCALDAVNSNIDYLLNGADALKENG